MAGDDGERVVHVVRRRWRLAGTTQTRLDRSPDEVGRVHVALLIVLVRVAAWLLSGRGVHAFDDPVESLESLGSRRTLQRWHHRLLPDAARVQGALRTAVLERSEPQPVERLFPSGISPPAAVRRRRWKDPEATYRLATGLAFLAEGAVALSTSATVLLAEAQTRLDGPLGIPRR